MSKRKIGIDPAFRKNGFAICVIEEKLVSFQIFETYEDFVLWIAFDNAFDENKQEVVFNVENSNLSNVTFERKGADSMGAKMAISRKAGKNQAVSEGCVRFLKKQGYVVNEISPKQKGKKLTTTYFQSLVISNGHRIAQGDYKGLEKEQDKRDAYQIARVRVF
jgi:hypothetical protein